MARLFLFSDVAARYPLVQQSQLTLDASAFTMSLKRKKAHTAFSSTVWRLPSRPSALWGELMMRTAMKRRAFALLGACTFAITLPCMAKPVPVDVESHIQAERWREASRAIFMEAAAIDHLALSPAMGLARAGLLNEALDLISRMPALTQASVLLTLAQKTSPLQPAEKAALVAKAIDISRKLPDQFKSEYLTRAALFHSSNGMETQARGLFTDALQAAGREQEGVRYRYLNLLQAIREHAPQVPDWMILQIKAQLPRLRDTANIAHAYTELTHVAVALQQKGVALAFLDVATQAAKKMDNDRMRHSAQAELALLSVELGRSYERMHRFPDALALQQARAGHLEQVLATVSGLGENLYVDHRLAVYQRVLDDALERGDLNAALYLAQRPIRRLPYINIDNWRKVAELQAQKGAHEAATASYQKAAAMAANLPGWERYLSEIRAVANLGSSMFHHGLKTEGRQVMLDALAMIERVSTRREDDRIAARTLMSHALWESEDRAAAKRELRQAYGSAHQYKGREKARLLGKMGEVTLAFFESSGQADGPKKSK